MTRVKICCIRDRDEAARAVAAGAHALGLVSTMPSGPGVIDDDTIAAIAASVPSAVATFLLTSAGSVREIHQQLRRCSAGTVQIVDRLTDGTHAELRALMPGLDIVQVIHVTGPEALAAAAAARGADAILLDSGNPDLDRKELGGTGRTHDWRLSRRIVERLSVPVFLAGGLRPDNVAEAIRAVRPFGVDVCSGVRTHDRLDQRKLEAFMAAVAAAG